MEVTGTVPVFDARDLAVEFEFTASSLSQLEDSLPLFKGEILEGSLATVAYTATYYYKAIDKSGRFSTDKACHLSANLQWVIVLGVPE